MHFLFTFSPKINIFIYFLLLVRPPGPWVGSIQLKISQFPVPLLYFFPATSPSPPDLVHPQASPIHPQSSPSPTYLPCLMHLHYTLKKWTIRKKIKYPVQYIYSVIHTTINKTCFWECIPKTMIIHSYSTILTVNAISYYSFQLNYQFMRWQ